MKPRSICGNIEQLDPNAVIPFMMSLFIDTLDANPSSRRKFSRGGMLEGTVIGDRWRDVHTIGRSSAAGLWELFADPCATCPLRPCLPLAAAPLAGGTSRTTSR